MFSIVKAADIAPQFRLPGWMTEKPDTILLLHRGDLNIGGHLALDSDIPHDVMRPLIAAQIIAWEKILPALCAGRPILAERAP